MMVVVDVEAGVTEAVGIIHVSCGSDKIQEWCITIMAYR